MLEVGLTVSISQAKKEDMVAGGNGSEDGDFMVPARHDLQLFSSSARDLRCARNKRGIIVDAADYRRRRQWSCKWV